MNDSVFQVDHLSLEYRGHRSQAAVSILEDVSFDLERGGALTLVGPSGSGGWTRTSSSGIRRRSPAARSSA